MAWAPDYCTTAELKEWLRITVSGDDNRLAAAISTASRNVDTYTGRQFGNVDEPADWYGTWDGSTIDYRDSLSIVDLYDTTDLVVVIDTDGDGDGDVTLENETDFDLWPYNAAAEGVPWTRLVLRPGAAARFNWYPRCVKITGLLGWADVPTAVSQATLLLAAEIFARRNAPFGIAGSPELGSEMRLLDKVDPDARTALRRYVRAAPGGWVAA